MATKKTTTTTKATTPKTEKAAPKAKAAKAAKAPAAPRHPKARADAAGGKAGLAKELASALAFGDTTAETIETRLKTASNAQLLRLQKAVSTVKSKFGGDRSKLIAAIGDANKKSKDKDYLAKLGTYSLPQLVDLATAAQRRAR